ncbi:MAG: IS66 family transposase [Verrucomicrobia bacterium]|nr:IS66 family transposase [Verrucomicrobiota bacterium]
MKITADIFEAFLKCPTKCYLRSLGEVGTGNAYADWLSIQNESSRREGVKFLTAGTAPGECVGGSSAATNLKMAKWQFAIDYVVRSQSLESRLHAVERIPSEGRSKPAQFIPIRFIPTNKISRDDKLLLAFDALVVSELLGHEVGIGRIIHGEDQATLKVKTSALAGEVRKRFKRITAILSNPAPPDLILNRHCAECEFQTRCRQMALETDDLSLLSGMSEKERKKFHGKGIFTVTQLSYTFRPRRRLTGEKYHHSLKALAIREKKIHIVGRPELKLEGTPVYLDVEGLPDYDFYYLIGVRIGNGESAIQYSLWADTAEDEEKIWREFLGILETVERPVLVHYGNYENIFLKRMFERYGELPAASNSAKALTSSFNLLSVIFARVYFPTYLNGLKDVAQWLGIEWSDKVFSGLGCIIARRRWEEDHDSSIREKLITYNAEDCHALQCVFAHVSRISQTRESGLQQGDKVVHTDSLKDDCIHRFGKIEFLIPDFERINKAAYWDYQQEKVQIRGNQNRRRVVSRTRRNVTKRISPNKTIEIPPRTSCPKCGQASIYKTDKVSRTVRDLKFGPAGVKRWIVNYVGFRYRCNFCGASFTSQEWPRHSEGLGLVSYVVYQLVELRISHRAIGRSLASLFGMSLPRTTVNRLKSRAAKTYMHTCTAMIESLVSGHLLHCDETPINILRKREFVWVFCNSDQVVFRRTETREGLFLKELLREFKGVLVTDFYKVYDSIRCPQQKCLIHLIRDLNNDLYKEPFNEELKTLASEFGSLLKQIVDTIDRFGLKTRFLRKHGQHVSDFFRNLSKRGYASETAAKYRERFERNRELLFTFLEHDGVTWHNNTAEHAIKGLARLRRAIGGRLTKRGVDDYLVLLSLLETCKCIGLNFLDFLRSGHTDIAVFADSRQNKISQSQFTPPKRRSSVEDQAAERRRPVAAVLRSIGGIVKGDRQIINNEQWRISTHDDNPGEHTTFYVAQEEGTTIGYPESDRAVEAVPWKTPGKRLSKEATTGALGEAAPQRYARRQAEQELYETTARQLADYLRGLASGTQTTADHRAKWMEAMPGAPMRNGDVLVPGYDSDGKLWTVQYIKKDGKMRFAKESRIYGCFHVVGAANGAAALQKIAMSPVVVIAETYAMATTISKNAKVAAIAAFNSTNFLPVATSLHERWPDKAIIIVGDDNHPLKNNPWCSTAAEAAKGM